MKKVFLTAFVAAVSCAFSYAQIAGVTFEGDLVYIDEDTGHGHVVGPLSIGWLGSMTRLPSGALLAATGGGSKIYKIDPIAATATIFAYPCVNDIRAMAFGPDGYLYVTDVVGAVKSTLYRLDFSVPLGDCSIKTPIGVIMTGGFTGQGPIQSPPIQAMTFGPDGVLYAWCGTGLIRINHLTAAATDVDGVIPTPWIAQSLAFGFDGVLYAIAGSQHETLFIVDPSNGSASAIGGAGWSNVRGIEFTSELLPDLQVSNQVSPGETIQVDLDTLRSPETSLLVAPGLGPTVIPSVGLTIDIGPTIDSVVVAFYGTPDLGSGGELRLEFPVPQHEALVGRTFYWQAYVMNSQLEFVKSDVRVTTIVARD